MFLKQQMSMDDTLFSYSPRTPQMQQRQISLPEGATVSPAYYLYDYTRSPTSQPHCEIKAEGDRIKRAISRSSSQHSISIARFTVTKLSEDECNSKESTSFKTDSRILPQALGRRRRKSKEHRQKRSFNL